uniref:DNA polymerase n=1 Tax=Dichomitus squalens TaxID=114155 RepID=UPI0030038B9C|nr:DNA polymerase [Dichomitus squalens]
MYKAYAKKAYYYDVRSLYPKAMCNLMPLKLIETIYNPALDKFNLDSFFGFIDLVIECPDSVINPVLPFKYKHRTIFPRGRFSGVYFSEEIKDVIKLGYKIISIKTAKRFTSGYIFNDYVKEMYTIKCNSIGSERWIAKLLLNSLYGIFGRKQETLRTITINNYELPVYLTCCIVKSISKINDQRSMLLIEGNVNKQIMKQLNATFTQLTSIDSPVKANVAIASAITSYARIFMNQFKQNHYIIYTDTDSIITTQPLPEHLLGSELGMFNDELNGCMIEEIYVLGIKQYGYWFYDKEGHRIEKSVWAGIQRNSLSFSEIESLFNGAKIVKKSDGRFFKSISELNISVKSVNTTIVFNPHQRMIGVNYKDLFINNESNDPLLLKLSSYINRIKRNLSIVR